MPSKAPQERARWEFSYEDDIVTPMKPEAYLPAGSEKVCFHSREGLKSRRKDICSPERPCGKVVAEAAAECSNPIYRHLGVCPYYRVEKGVRHRTNPNDVLQAMKKAGLRMKFRDLVSIASHMQFLVNQQAIIPVGATLPSELESSLSSISEEPDTPSPAPDRARVTPSNIIRGARARRAVRPEARLYAAERHELLAADVEDEEWYAAFMDGHVSDASVASEEDAKVDQELSVLEELMMDMSVADPLSEEITPTPDIDPMGQGPSMLAEMPLGLSEETYGQLADAILADPNPIVCAMVRAVRILLDGGTFDHMFGTCLEPLIKKRWKVPAIDICTAGGMRTLDEKGEIELFCIGVIEGWINPYLPIGLISETRIADDLDWVITTSRQGKHLQAGTSDFWADRCGNLYYVPPRLIVGYDPSGDAPMAPEAESHLVMGLLDDYPTSTSTPLAIEQGFNHTVGAGYHRELARPDATTSPCPMQEGSEHTAALKGAAVTATDASGELAEQTYMRHRLDFMCHRLGGWSATDVLYWRTAVRALQHGFIHNSSRKRLEPAHVRLTDHICAS